MADKKSSAKKIGRALLAGLAAGAAIGYLTAPQKGKKTREDLKKKLNEFVAGVDKENLKKIFGEFAQEGQEMLGKVHEELAELFEASKKAVMNREEYEKLVGEAVTKYSRKFKKAGQQAKKIKDEIVKSLGK